MNAGTIYLVKAPFVHTTYTAHDDGRFYEQTTWRPGVSYYPSSGGDSDMEFEPVCEAEGQMVLTILSVAEVPAPFKTRIIYTKEWIDPDGKLFGKKLVKMISIQGFKNMIKGWRHPYSIDIEKGKYAFELAQKRETYFDFSTAPH